VTFQLATVTQATGDCRRAEGYFTETLTLRADHEDARLGRAVCRTYLSNTEGAIADATVLIDAATSNRAEAYYWRAWNRRAQKQVEMARSDIDGSRALLYNARVLTLAGMIEHDQAEFDKAKEDLTRAIFDRALAGERRRFRRGRRLLCPSHRRERRPPGGDGQTRRRRRRLQGASDCRIRGRDQGRPHAEERRRSERGDQLRPGR
jgi:hypothetical protein